MAAWPNARTSTGSVFSDFFDSIGNFINGVPGGDWIVTAINNGATWIGDAAKTTTGQVILFAISGALYQALASGAVVATYYGQPVTVALGPQLASVAFAVPGLVAGDNFASAYAQALTTRVVKLLQYVSLGEIKNEDVQAFQEDIKSILGNPEIQKAVNELKALYGDENSQQLQDRAKGLVDPDTIASKTGKRPDSAAAAVNGFWHKFIYDINGQFDSHGRMLPPGYHGGFGGQGLPAGLNQPPPPSGMKIPPLPTITTPPVTSQSIAMPGGKSVLFAQPIASGGMITKLMIFAGLTSPLWLPAFVLPHAHWPFRGKR